METVFHLLKFIHNITRSPGGKNTKWWATCTGLAFYGHWLHLHLCTWLVLFLPSHTIYDSITVPVLQYIHSSSEKLAQAGVHHLVYTLNRKESVE